MAAGRGGTGPRGHSVAYASSRDQRRRRFAIPADRASRPPPSGRDPARRGRRRRPTSSPTPSRCCATSTSAGAFIATAGSGASITAARCRCARTSRPTACTSPSTATACRAHVDAFSPLTDDRARAVALLRYGATVAHNLVGVAHDLVALLRGRQGDHALQSSTASGSPHGSPARPATRRCCSIPPRRRGACSSTRASPGRSTPTRLRAALGDVGGTATPARDRLEVVDCADDEALERGRARGCRARPVPIAAAAAAARLPRPPPRRRRADAQPQPRRLRRLRRRCTSLQPHRARPTRATDHSVESLDWLAARDAARAARRPARKPAAAARLRRGRRADARRARTARAARRRGRAERRGRLRLSSRRRCPPRRRSAVGRGDGLAERPPRA